MRGCSSPGMGIYLYARRDDGRNGRDYHALNEQPDLDKTETVHCSSGKLVPTLISPDLDSNTAVKISLVCPISSD